MSKNAYVLDDHYGDNGSVTAGMILRDISSTRFTELEKKKLVREATAKEVEAGSQRTIDPDESKAEGGEKKAPEPANKKAADPKTKDA